MSYRKIEPRMWDDERFAPLSKDAKLAWLCILTGPHTTPLPGLFVCGIATLSESLRDDIDTVSKAVNELCGAGLVRFNATTRVMQVPNAPKYNPCANPKVLKGWFTVWKGVPDCVEKYAHVARVRAALDESQAWVKDAWSATFGTVKVPTRYGIDTVSETVSISGSGARTSAGAGGGAGETAPAPPVVTPGASPPGVTPSGAPSAPSAEDLAAMVVEQAARIAAEERASAEAAKRAEAEARKAKREARKTAAESMPDTIPLPGTPARRVYDAIVRDRVLAPITANPGDFADRVTAPGAYPGVDVLAIVLRAAEYAATVPGKYADGRRFLRNQLQSKADEVARAPKPAGASVASPVAPPSASQPHAPKKVYFGDEFAAAARAAREDA